MFKYDFSILPLLNNTYTNNLMKEILIFSDLRN